MLDLLKRETQIHHQALEQKMPLMRSTLTLNTYKNIITQFFTYYLPLEALILAEDTRHEINFNYAERLKVPLLNKDLGALNIRTENLPECGHLPTINSVPALLGCLYVIEGSTLGGQIISKHLQQCLNLTPDTGAAFFAGYGDKTGVQWKTFREFFNSTYLHFNQSQQTIIDTANETFMTLDAWLFREPHELIA